VTSDRRPLSATLGGLAAGAAGAAGTGAMDRCPDRVRGRDRRRAEHHTRGGAPDLGFHLVYGLGVATAFKAVER
jgi:hypothetical protein